MKEIDWRTRAIRAEQQLAPLSSKRVKRDRNGDYRPGDAERIDAGIALLKKALDNFKAGGAVMTAHRVRLALSSAKGARRNVDYRRGRSERASSR